MVECCLCEPAVELPSWDHLAAHIVAHHTNDLRSGLFAHNSRSVLCACNRWFRVGPVPAKAFTEWVANSPGTFARHLEGRGGLAAHLLEVALNARGRRRG